MIRIRRTLATLTIMVARRWSQATATSENGTAYLRRQRQHQMAHRAGVDHRRRGGGLLDRSWLAQSSGQGVTRVADRHPHRPCVPAAGCGDGRRGCLGTAGWGVWGAGPGRRWPVGGCRAWSRAGADGVAAVAAGLAFIRQGQRRPAATPTRLRDACPLDPGPAVAGRPRRRAAVLGPGQAARGSPGPAAPLAHRRPAVHRRRRARDVPAGGVGINLAIQDAVAAARLLAGPLRRGVVTPAELARVRRRRLPATVAIQGLQRILHQTALRPALEGTVDLAATSTPPLPLRLVQRSSLLQRIPTYLVARGVRPERAPQFARRAPQPVTS